jgi:O-antigen/teichoic acid export membrane protein
MTDKHRISEAEQAWDAKARDETPAKRLDRNWSELVQEIRVVQTGVQLLTGFLLTLPFQQRFSQLSHVEKGLYLTTVCLSISATAFLQAPVSVHRSLFRRHQREQAVRVAHYLSILGIALLAGAIVGVAALIFDVVAGTASAIAVTVFTVVLLAVLWLAIPLGMRDRRPPQ